MRLADADTASSPASWGRGGLQREVRSSYSGLCYAAVVEALGDTVTPTNQVVLLDIRPMRTSDLRSVAALDAAMLPNGFFAQLGTRFLRSYTARSSTVPMQWR